MKIMKYTPFPQLSKLDINELNLMSIEELRFLNELVVGMIKNKRKESALEVKGELQVGQTVKVNHPKLMGKQLRVEKINRTKAVLQLLNGFACYTVPLSMVEVVK
jgi:hypothetical protein